MLSLLETQINYFSHVIERRNQFSDQAMNTPISTYFKGEDRTPLELAYHAVSPLNEICEIIGEPTLEWGETRFEPLNLRSSSNEFIELYLLVLDKARKALDNPDTSEFRGNMAEVGTDQELLETRLKIFAMHLMTHYSQAIKFQGLICQSLAD